LNLARRSVQDSRPDPISGIVALAQAATLARWDGDT
jgi:hypothetical protein